RLGGEAAARVRPGAAPRRGPLGFPAAGGGGPQGVSAASAGVCRFSLRPPSGLASWGGGIGCIFSSAFGFGTGVVAFPLLLACLERLHGSSLANSISPEHTQTKCCVYI
ncbi:unnamed protein product, partial [Heterosigma akashiwo]